MNKYWWYHVAIAGLILVGGLVLGHPKIGIIIAVGWMVGTVIFNHFFNKKSKKAPSDAKNASESPKDDPLQRFRDAVESLIALNQSARLDPRLTDGQVAEIENVIDVGLRVVDAASEKFTGHPMSFEICRIVSHWLPDHVNRFAAMSETARQAGLEEFFSALQSLRKELEENERLIQQGDEIKYVANLAMITMKYGKE
jgi:hypothetical protein